MRALPWGIITPALVLAAGLWGGYATVSGSGVVGPASPEMTTAALFFWLMVSASGATGLVRGAREEVRRRRRKRGS